MRRSGGFRRRTRGGRSSSQAAQIRPKAPAGAGRRRCRATRRGRALPAPAGKAARIRSIASMMASVSVRSMWDLLSIWDWGLAADVSEGSAQVSADAGHKKTPGQRMPRAQFGVLISSEISYEIRFVKEFFAGGRQANALNFSIPSRIQIGEPVTGGSTSTRGRRPAPHHQLNPVAASVRGSAARISRKASSSRWALLRSHSLSPWRTNEPD
jgi:hypothetical protein